MSFVSVSGERHMTTEESPKVWTRGSYGMGCTLGDKKYDCINEPFVHDNGVKGDGTWQQKWRDATGSCNNQPSCVTYNKEENCPSFLSENGRHTAMAHRIELLDEVPVSWSRGDSTKRRDRARMRCHYAARHFLDDRQVKGYLSAFPVKDGKGEHGKLKREYCTRLENVDSPLCREWCANRKDGACDRAMTAYCKRPENADLDWCACINADTIPRPVCFDARCSRHGFRTLREKEDGGRCGTACIQVINCMSEGRCDVDNNKFQQHCPGMQDPDGDPIEYDTDGGVYVPPPPSGDDDDGGGGGVSPLVYVIAAALVLVLVGGIGFVVLRSRRRAGA